MSEEHVHRFGPDYLSVCGAAPTDALEDEVRSLRERNAELERVLANLGVQLNAGGSGDPAGGEVE